MDMTFRHLEIFKAVVETGSFTKAAKKLFITQSAVSHGIHDLEKMTKTPLFDRLSHRVQITRTGNYCYKKPNRSWLLAKPSPLGSKP